MGQLTKSQTVSYAAGGLAMNLTNLVISQWLVDRYVPDQQHALVPAAALGVFILLGRLMDAVSDPIIGYWSDNLRSRRGRRIPFILWGLVPFAAVFFLIWTPPAGAGPWVNGVYVFLVLQLYFIFYTAVVGPYLALIPELSADGRERLNITTAQAVFVMVGSLLFGAAGWLRQAGGWPMLGGFVAVLTVGSFLPTLLAIRERPHPPAEKPAGGRLRFFAYAASTFRNAPFLYVAISTALYWFALSLMLLVAPAWVKQVLGKDEGHVSTIMMPFLGTNLVFFFVFNALAKRLGKYAMFLITLAGTAVAFPLLGLVGRLPFGDPLAQTCVVMGAIGIPVAGFLMLPYALLADVADYDETFTGRRREAIYVGVQAIFQKTAIGGATVAYLVLAFAGDVPAPTEGNLKLAAIVAGAACAAACAVFLLYPLRDSRRANATPPKAHT